jgi:hypothetical protein
MLGTSLQKRLRMECLEEKVPLAGDVMIAVVNGDLVITGDAADNSFIIEEATLFDGHQYRVFGRDLTNVNGVTNEWVFFDGVTRDVIVDLGDGADTFRGYGYPNAFEPFDFALKFPRDLVITTGAGEDHIALGVTEVEEFFNEFNFGQSPVQIGRDLVMNLGGDADSILMSATAVGDDLSISDTGGNTEIIVWPSFLYPMPSFVDLSVGDDLSVNLGSGDDLIDISMITIGGDATYGLGGGSDYASLLGFTAGGSVMVNAGAGANEVHVESGTVGGGVMVSGSGTNNFQLSALTVASSIVMLSNSNDDQLYVIGSTAGTAIINAGGGADYVQVTDSALDLLMVNLGSGNDTLNLDGVTSTLALLIGGGGSDTLQESADNNFLMALELSFEMFEAI